MDYNNFNKIPKSLKEQPKRTILILLIMGLFALVAFYFSGYFGEMGKKAASDNGTEKKASNGIQIGEIKTGDKNLVVLGDNATINYYDVSPAVVDDLRKRLNLNDRESERLLKTIDEKDVAIEDRDAKFEELAQKYKGLEERLAKRSAEDELAAQAKQKLEEGNLEGVEKILRQSLQKNLQANAEKKKAAAADAFDLGSVKELQLDYAGAKKFFEQAVQLEPDNTDYMNKIGFIFDKLGDYQKANDYYKKALDINRKVYGDQRPIPPPKFFTNNIGMEFVLISAGSFTKERQDRTVKISRPFYLQKTEVTQGQWKNVMGDNPSHFNECGNECPVESVSWEDARKFINKLNEMEGVEAYRLPTETEWEYSVRAGTTTVFFFGYEEDKLIDYAWFVSNSNGKTHRVGQKEPNPWGLYDMYGNVWEWVEDIFHSNYEAAPNDERAWIDEIEGSRRVMRGGGWGDGAHDCRSASRFNFAPDGHNTFLGFRLARSFTLGP